MVTRAIRIARRPRIRVGAVAVALALGLALAVVGLQARSLWTSSWDAPRVAPAEAPWPIGSSGIDHPGAYRGGYYVGWTISSDIDHPGVYRGGRLVAGPGRGAGGSDR
jgi:hypothetical protein